MDTVSLKFEYTVRRKKIIPNEVQSDKACCNNATRDGTNPACDGDCQVARAVYVWARAEQRFVGINPW